MLAQRGIDALTGDSSGQTNTQAPQDPDATRHFPLAVIIKPNYEGSSKNIGDDAVVPGEPGTRRVLPRALGPGRRKRGEYRKIGTDIGAAVPFLGGRGDECNRRSTSRPMGGGAPFSASGTIGSSRPGGGSWVRALPTCPRRDLAPANQSKMGRALGIRGIERMVFRRGSRQTHRPAQASTPRLGRAGGRPIRGREAQDPGRTPRRSRSIVKARRGRQTTGRSSPKGGACSAEPLGIDSPSTSSASIPEQRRRANVSISIAPSAAATGLPLGDSRGCRASSARAGDLVFNIAENVATLKTAMPARSSAHGHPYANSDAAASRLTGACRRTPAIRGPHGRVSGHGDGPRAPVVEAEVPAHRQARNPRGLVERA